MPGNCKRIVQRWPLHSQPVVWPFFARVPLPSKDAGRCRRRPCHLCGSESAIFPKRPAGARLTTPVCTGTSRPHRPRFPVSLGRGGMSLNVTGTEGSTRRGKGMKAIRVHAFGGEEVLTPKEVPDLAPGPARCSCRFMRPASTRRFDPRGLVPDQAGASLHARFRCGRPRPHHRGRGSESGIHALSQWRIFRTPASVPSKPRL